MSTNTEDFRASFERAREGRVWWRPIPADSVDTQPPRDALGNDVDAAVAKTEHN